ncbi:MAG: hypothetical protein K2Q03_02810, partial [Sphingobacteriaceae bacterium]|nr:hypothetical protein [Sphingobacteriaceae bacterium]
MKYKIEQIVEILHSNSNLHDKNSEISTLITDSRKIIYPELTLFFAIIENRNGHLFIENAYQKGVRNFVISEIS